MPIKNLGQLSRRMGGWWLGLFGIPIKNKTTIATRQCQCHFSLLRFLTSAFGSIIHIHIQTHIHSLLVGVEVEVEVGVGVKVAVGEAARSKIEKAGSGISRV